MNFKHHAKLLTPDYRFIADNAMVKLMDDIMKLINSMSNNVYDDLKSLEKIESFTSTTLPAASVDNLGKMCLYTSGTDPQIVKVCCITGTSPIAYGWKRMDFYD